jgi:hypothetical protein
LGSGLFFSDHSSITLDATTINAGTDNITVQVGRCNTKSASKTIGEMLPEPDGNTLSVCLNNGSNLDVPLTTDPNITYIWDITADGNGYSYVSGNANTQGPVTINVGSNNSGYVLLTSKARPGNGQYCDKATRIDTIRYARSNNDPKITGPTCVMPGEKDTFSVDLSAPISWNFPAGYTITSAETTASSVEVEIGSGVADGNVSAASSNSSCGSSPAYQYVKAGPGKPSITGPSCFDASSNVTYSASGSNSDTYSWTFPSGFSPSSSDGNNIQPYTGTSTGGYVIVYGKKSECPNSEPDTLEVLPKPGPVYSINSDKSCLNKDAPDEITLTTECGYAAYEWTFTNPNWYIDGTDNGCSVTVITDGNGSDVTVQAVNDCGSGQSFTKTYTADGIGQAVSITQYPNSQGTGVILEVNLFGASYQWYQDGSPISGGRLLDLPYADAETHTYCVEVSYGQCATMVCADAAYTPSLRKAIGSFNVAETVSDAITIAPNPAHNYVELIAHNGLTGVNYTIVNTSGINVAKGTFTTGKNVIDINNWPSGIFVVKYEVNGKLNSQKFQVQ